MFITLGESIQEIILERIRRAKSLGILADEAANVAVFQQLIIFLKYVNPDMGVAKTEFLATKCIDDPRGANAEVITNHILDTLTGIRKAVRHARMAHKATKWPIKKILTGPVMRPDRTKLVK